MDSWESKYGDLRENGGSAPDVYARSYDFLKNDYPDVDFLTRCTEVIEYEDDESEEVTRHAVFFLVSHPINSAHFRECRVIDRTITGKNMLHDEPSASKFRFDTTEEELHEVEP